jgi:uncharacterized protein
MTCSRKIQNGGSYRMNRKQRLSLSVAAILGVGIIYIVFKFLFLNFFLDWWWFESLGYEGYFWIRIMYRYMIFGAVTLIFFLIFFFNFWIASRYLGTTDNAETESLKKHKEIIRMFQRGSLKIYTPLSFFMAVPIAIPLYEKWEQALLWFFSKDSGMTETTFGKDISFYLFSLPIYKLINTELFIAFLLLLVFLIILYKIESRMLSKEDMYLPEGARIHLNILFLVVVMIKAYDYFLQRYDLLYMESHAPIFSGPGFTDMNITLPMIWITLVSLICTALFMMIYIRGKKGLKPLIGFTLLFLLCIGIRTSSFLPDFIEQYYVKPSQVVRESPYIERNIRDTLAAYNLSHLETGNYPLRSGAEIVITDEIRNTIRNIPVWDKDMIDDVYTQMQGMRSFYHVAEADIDRYTIGGVKQQVYLAAREINIEGLPSGAKNWNNTHLVYTHGYGIMMTPAIQRGEEPIKWVVQDIPMRSDKSLSIGNAAIYYGPNTHEYAIVPNKSGEIDHFDGDKDVKADYSGKGGVVLSGLRKFLFWAYFGHQNIFLTTDIKATAGFCITEILRKR